MRQTLNLIYIALVVYLTSNAGGSNEVAVPFSATADDTH
jgi:hypothetical protein